MSLSNLLIIFSSSFMALFPVINPLGNGFVVNGFFTDLDPQQRKAAIQKLTLNFIMIGVGTLVIGHLFLLIFGLAIPVIQLGGGMLICKTAMELLGDSGSSDKEETSKNVDGFRWKNIEQKIFYPITFPISIGPGSISVIFTLMASASVKGKLNSCNYTCSYCPFGKKSHLADTTQDEQAWNRFIAAIEQWKGEPLQLFIIPYGEALIHRYYRKGMMHLAALPQVAGISCQTNLSFPAKHWLDEIRVAPTVISKIRLWASFHPEMTSVEKFAHQIHILHHAGIQVCAGAVGNPSAKAVLNDLRNALLPDIYLFINAMQGLRAPLSQEDIQFFSQLDNLFEYDLKNAPAQWEVCAGGRDNCFIDWKGDMYACPRSRVKIGNFYQGDGAVVPLSCKRKVCDCYIAFSNLNNHPLHRIMGEGAFWRIPDKPLITTVFFDVDGTLTDSQGKVPESYANALRYMAQSVSLYLATSLSMEQAKKKLGKALFDLFRGGVFADGGLLSYSRQIKCLPVKVYPEVYGESSKVTIHSYEGVVYKYSILVRDKE